MIMLREHARPPRLLGLYARSLAATLHRGGDGEIPALQLTLRGARPDPANLARYRSLCAAGEGPLPGAYPHLLAFPLHLELMSDQSFPFSPVGLVHIENRLRVHRPIDPAERLDIHVRATPLEAHAKGLQFTILTEARAAGELVWVEDSTMLRRGPGSPRSTVHASPALPASEEHGEPWTLPAGLGRSYASVSGDRNPIHLSRASARLFGFPHPIAHGMWTLGRSLGALQGLLGDAYTVGVRFRSPIPLPGRVIFTRCEQEPGILFAVRSATHLGQLHLNGSVSA